LFSEAIYNWSSEARKETERGSLRGGTPFSLLKVASMHGNGIPTVEVVKNALWTALRTIFWPKNALVGGVAQWLGRQSVAGGCSLIYAPSMVDM